MRFGRGARGLRRFADVFFMVALLEHLRRMQFCLFVLGLLKRILLVLFLLRLEGSVSHSVHSAIDWSQGEATGVFLQKGVRLT